MTFVSEIFGDHWDPEKYRRGCAIQNTRTLFHAFGHISKFRPILFDWKTCGRRLKVTFPHVLILGAGRKMQELSEMPHSLRLERSFDTTCPIALGFKLQLLRKSLAF